MRSGNEDYQPRKHPQNRNTQIKFNLKFLALIVLTNLLTIYFFTGPFNLTTTSNYAHILGYNSLFHELNSTQRELKASRLYVTDLHEKLRSSDRLVQALLAQLNVLNRAINQTPDSNVLSYDDLLAGLSDEARLSMGSHKLPLGYAPRMGSDEVYPPVGGACLRYGEELARYMSYVVGEECPVDDGFAQKLMLRGCEPLPRRRCHPKSPVGYTEPTPLPDSLWSTPPDTSIIWDPYSCKSYKCLIERRLTPGFYDCKDCFHLQGREKNRWLFDNGGLDFGIDQVLATKPHGTIRIGLDIGGGSGTFAARMKERDITIITTSMNFDGPFNSFISSRGLLSMHLSVSQRLPFFENTLDIVHSMHVLSNWIPHTLLEFTLFDIYRVLRPGGLFWLDRFFCIASQLNSTYAPMIERVGFKKLRWHAGMKLDKGRDKNEWYFSALLEKPMT
nr:Methyltransferase type [Ipomoea batatas]GME11804.1 Methyltransferase type [Ipomoea batatas]